MGSKNMEYKGIRKTSGPKGKGKKQARKGIRKQGKRDPSNYCSICGGKKSGWSDNYFVMTCYCSEMIEYDPYDDGTY